MRSGSSWVHIMALTVLFAVLTACGTAAPEPTPAPEPTTAPTNGVQPEPTPTPTPSEPDFDAAAYFSGQRISIVVGFAPGGGYDTAARLLARFGPEYFPGSPQFIVTNRPGAGSLLALQQTMRSEPDGFTAHPIHSSFPHAAIRGDQIEDFDMDTVQVVGGVSCGDTVTALYVRRSIAETWADVQALGQPITSGMTQPDESSGTGPRLVEILGGPIRNIAGYGGTSEIMAAFDRGELDATTRGGQNVVPNLYPEWITGRVLAPVFYSGPEPEADPEWLEWLDTIDAPVPPHVFEIVDASEGQQAIFETVRGINSMWGHAFVLPPGTPEEVVEVWREALRGITSDAGYLEAAATLGYQAQYCPPEELMDAYQSGREALDREPELEGFLNRLMGEGW